jgi:hypothetical protein
VESPTNMSTSKEATQVSSHQSFAPPSNGCLMAIQDSSSQAINPTEDIDSLMEEVQNASLGTPLPTTNTPPQQLTPEMLAQITRHLGIAKPKETPSVGSEPFRLPGLRALWQVETPSPPKKTNKRQGKFTNSKLTDPLRKPPPITYERPGKVERSHAVNETEFQAWSRIQSLVTAQPWQKDNPSDEARLNPDGSLMFLNVFKELAQRPFMRRPPTPYHDQKAWTRSKPSDRGKA